MRGCGTLRLAVSTLLPVESHGLRSSPTFDGYDGAVQARVEELPENRVRLTVEVPSHDVRHAVEHAASDLSTSVKIPGFRKGKVPMPVLISRIGKERLYSEAVESHIGGWVPKTPAGAPIPP